MLDSLLPANILLLGSLAAKPTFMQTFLPAACLFYLVQWIRRPKATPFVVQTLLWVLPAVALMVLQYLYYFGIIVPYQSGMVLEQMTPEQFAGNIPVKSYAELVAMTQDTCFDSHAGFHGSHASLKRVYCYNNFHDITSCRFILYHRPGIKKW